MGKSVKFVKLHQGVFIPNLGNLGDSLPPPTKTVHGLIMTLEPEGLLIHTSKTDAIIPLANIAILELSEPYVTVVKAKAKE